MEAQIDLSGAAPKGNGIAAEPRTPNHINPVIINSKEDAEKAFGKGNIIAEVVGDKIILDNARTIVDGEAIDSIPIDERGFLAICDIPGDGEGIFTVAAKDRKGLRAKIASLTNNETKEASNITRVRVLEVYRVTRLELATQVTFKF